MTSSSSRVNAGSSHLEQTIPGSTSTTLGTVYGSFNVTVFHGTEGDKCLLVSKRPFTDPLFVRVHSACLFGEALGSLECDCRQQLDLSLKIAAERSGVLVYLFQEGRGLGLEAKIRGMALQQETNVGSHEAYRRLGLIPDARQFSLVGEALRAIGAPDNLVVLTANNRKIKALEEAGFTVSLFGQRH